MQVFIYNESEYALSIEHEKMINNIIRKSLELEGYNTSAEVSVTVVTNLRIRELNNEYRGIDKVTDVLSFPIIDFKNGELPPEKGNYLLGDIVFSFSKAIEQSKEYGHSVDREVGFFIAHSMLHLLGYDHKDVVTEQIMFNKQDEILKLVGINR